MADPPFVATVDEGESAAQRHRTRRLYREIAEVSEHGIVVLDRAARVTYASLSVEAFIGLPPGRVLGTSVFDYVEPDEAEFAVETFVAKLAAPKLRHHPAELHLRGPGGRQLVQVTGHVFDNDERVDGMVLLLRHVGVRASLHDILGSIMRHEPVTATLEVIVSLVIDHVGASAAAVSYPTVDDREIVAVGVSPDAVSALLNDARPEDDANRPATGAIQPSISFSEGPAVCSAIALLSPAGEVLGHMAVWFEGGLRETPNRAVYLERLQRMATFAIDRNNRARLMAHAAGHDPLTGALNRSAFIAELEAARSARSEGRPAVLFVDLDGFKAVNDEHGHRIGDEVLISVTNRMRALLEPTSHVARLGGDEFAVLCHDVTAQAEVLAVADLLVESVRCPIVVGDAVIRLSASVGIAFDSDDAVSAEVLLGRADVALYRAKRSGKGNWQIAEAEGSG